MQGWEGLDSAGCACAIAFEQLAQVVRSAAAAAAASPLASYAVRFAPLCLHLRTLVCRSTV